MIYIAMMSRTDEPMEGVVFDVQDHARGPGFYWRVQGQLK
jgi:hypothetical protein